MSQRRAPKPRKMVVIYRETTYCFDLAACRRALVSCQVAGKFDTMDELAAQVGCSRSTTSRFLSGRSPTGLATTLRILEQLGLSFDDVARPIETIDDCE